MSSEETKGQKEVNHIYSIRLKLNGLEPNVQTKVVYRASHIYPVRYIRIRLLMHRWMSV